MSHERILKLDPLVHAPVRLAILTLLAEMDRADFVLLREATETTDGNLSAHLRKLDDAGYVSIRKRFVDRKPRTTCSMTKKGRRAYIRYLEQLEKILEARNTGLEV